MTEAIKYSVLPLDDRTLERLNAALVGRPDLMADRTSLTVYQGMTENLGECLYQCEEPVAHNHSRRGSPARRRLWRDPRAGASVAGAFT
jgi:hypothetical protein